MLRDALFYPQRGPGWLWTVITGSLLTLVGAVLFVPLIPVQGYLLRVLRSTADGRPHPPKFEDWGDLFVDGARVIGVQVAYLLVPVLVTLGGVLARVSGAPLLGSALLLFASVVGLASAYLLPGALTRLATTDRLTAAFEIRVIASVARRPIYVVAVVEAYVALFVIAGLGGVLVLILVGAVFAFYGQVVGYHLFARGYAGATGDGQDPMHRPQTAAE
ncbi:DUF4013 domain-containing protein [Halomicroarcula sp. S1AR25-4]|uniref:DUF4013 domain-containing protein n=1 Tax=Haloarcula sp. S1AR25-4 TaxID=2950538 RepID=UPI0028747581|nr:DUF4013 domain-containing protein [Halomicroarcula sp. S1AR25-4]MDS0276903.1 DUF4013 domain-containing protein [Halomicroarcula sp. S1AR25-4]